MESQDDRRHTRAKQRMGTSNQRQPKQTKASSGLSGVQSRGSQKARWSRGTDDIQGVSMPRWGSGTTRHTQTDTRLHLEAWTM